jgi:hypothetical protein
VRSHGSHLLVRSLNEQITGETPTAQTGSLAGGRMMVTRSI